MEGYIELLGSSCHSIIEKFLTLTLKSNQVLLRLSNKVISPLVLIIVEPTIVVYSLYRTNGCHYYIFSII